MKIQGYQVKDRLGEGEEEEPGHKNGQERDSYESHTFLEKSGKRAGEGRQIWERDVDERSTGIMGEENRRDGDLVGERK